MKKAIFYLLAVILLTVSCQEKKDTFTLTGSMANDSHEGKAIYLLTMDSLWREWVIIDTTYIKEGKFSFTGEVNKDKSIVTFRLEDAELYKGVLRIPVFIEAGNTEIVTSEYGSYGAKGTPMNDAVMDFFSTLGQKGAPDSYLMAEFIKENNQNLIGAFFLPWITDYISVEEVKEILASMNPKLKEYAAIRNVEKLISSREETSVDKPFVDVKGKTPDENDAVLSDYINKDGYSVIHFWSLESLSSIRGDIPFLTEHYDDYKANGIEVISVSVDTDMEEWRKAIDKWDITWPQISDLKGWDSEFLATYGVYSVPYYVLIDKDGKIVERDPFLPTVGGSILEELLKLNY